MEHLDLARKAVDRMYELVDELLELARKGTLVDGTATVDFEECARRAWESVPACGSRLRVVASYPLEADADRLGELLENLFRNAVEHGSAGGVPDRGEAVVAGAGEEGGVEVRLGPIPDPDDPGRVVGFFVEDDGPGIPEERRADVLRFGYTTREGGTGFGLTIVESIAGAHGWEVTVTESASGGARFEFRHGRRDHP
jgi:signal transduction histidine kinase